MADSLRFNTQSSLARRHKLNPIIEEDSDNDGHFEQTTTGGMVHQSRRADTSNLHIQAWLSPMSDHFPTPRGNHFLPAPVLQSSESELSSDEISPTTTPHAWNRISMASQVTEFEDLYDVSDEEDSPPTGLQRRSSVRNSTGSRRLSRLLIPSHTDNSNETRVGFDEFKKIASPIPLTPSANFPMSPAQLQFMDQQQAMEIPGSSAPPSLDGSLTSEQLAAMSAPPTPVISNDDGAVEEAWAGVHLQPGALATLRTLSMDSDVLIRHDEPSQVIEIPESPPQPTTQMQQQPLRVVTRFQSGTDSSRQSLADLTRLDIPSPGGFFDTLSPRSRNTWNMLPKSPDAMAPPTSTTAEQFYRCPWNTQAEAPPVPQLPQVPPQLPQRPDIVVEDFYRSLDQNLSTTPVEQIIEIQYEEEPDDMPTARPVFEQKISDETVKAPTSPAIEQLTEEDTPIEIVAEVDSDYALKQQKEALSYLDRTQLWLLAQQAYLKPVDEHDETLDKIPEATKAEEEPEVETPEPLPQPVLEPVTGQCMIQRKKTVRFSGLISVATQPKRLPSQLVRPESAYYRAFQDYVIRVHSGDVFVGQLARFESLQAQRISLRDSHRNQLLGKYQLSVVPQSAKKRLSTNVVRGDDKLTDDLDKIRQEKEYEAANQMAMPTWQIAAIKFLNGGRLITAPVTKRLARLSLMAPSIDGTTRDRARILDLGGQSTCDWAWHCALQYPNTKIYTVTTKAIRQLSNSNIRGPSNHRQVAVERLAQLPFGDNQFDLIYARELHSILKFTGENGEDEWETCLAECMRVLKPGGYLEFSLLDSDMMNAGPLGLAKSVEFGFTLKTLGYDPSPSKMWLGRLARAGFEDVRRTWLCLPVGAKRSINKLETCVQPGAPLMGSSENIASVCSIVGGWSWERWLLRCEMEKVAGELRLADTVTSGAAIEEAGKCLDGVAAVMEEGRNCKAGFRMLNGYARKPRVNSEVIRIALAD